MTYGNEKRELCRAKSEESCSDVVHDTKRHKAFHEQSNELGPAEDPAGAGHHASEKCDSATCRGFETTKEAHWNEIYVENHRNGTNLEYLLSYETFRPFIRKVVDFPELPILVPGCGDSDFSRALLADGFGKIHSVDKSHVVIELMREKYAHLEAKGLEFSVEDMTDSDFLSLQFAYIFDKSLIDCLFSCHDDAQSWPELVRDTLNEYYRLLIDGGVAVILSTRKPEWFLPFVDSNRIHPDNDVAHIISNDGFMDQSDSGWISDYICFQVKCSDNGKEVRRGAVPEILSKEEEEEEVAFGSYKRFYMYYVQKPFPPLAHRKGVNLKGIFEFYKMAMETSKRENDADSDFGSLDPHRLREECKGDDEFCSCPSCRGAETSQVEYWDKLYQRNWAQHEHAEYLLSFATLKPYLEKHLSYDPLLGPTLVPGCGDSPFSYHLYKFGGHQRILSTDISTVAVTAMAQAYAEEKPNLDWFIDDMTDSSIAPETIGYIVDKSLIDCFYWVDDVDNPPERLISMSLGEYYRILVKGGKCLIITTRRTDSILPFIDSSHSFGSRHPFAESTLPMPPKSWKYSVVIFRVPCNENEEVETTAEATLIERESERDPPLTKRYYIYVLEK